MTKLIQIANSSFHQMNVKKEDHVYTEHNDSGNFMYVYTYDEGWFTVLSTVLENIFFGYFLILYLVQLF